MMVFLEYRVVWGEKRMCWVLGWEDYFEDGRSRVKSWEYILENFYFVGGS